MEQKTFRTLIICTVAVLLIWAVAGTYKSCKSDDAMDRYKSEIKVLRASAEIADMEYKRVLKLRDAKIAEMDVLIVASKVVVTELEGDIAERDNLLSDLKHQLDSLPNEDTIVTLRKRVDILTETVEQWREKFVLAEAIIAGKDTQIFALSAKYDIEHLAHLQLQSAYTGLYEYNQGLVRFNTELKRAWSRNKFWGSVKTGGLIAAGAVIIYSILKGNQ